MIFVAWNVKRNPKNPANKIANILLFVFKTYLKIPPSFIFLAKWEIGKLVSESIIRVFDFTLILWKLLSLALTNHLSRVSLSFTTKKSLKSIYRRNLNQYSLNNKTISFIIFWKPQFPNSKTLKSVCSPTRIHVPWGSSPFPLCDESPSDPSECVGGKGKSNFEGRVGVGNSTAPFSSNSIFSPANEKRVAS